MPDIEINIQRLLQNAPDILKDCRFVLNWLEIKGEGSSMAGLKIKSAIRLLEHSGVHEFVRDSAEEGAILPPDFSMVTADIVD